MNSEYITRLTETQDRFNTINHETFRAIDSINDALMMGAMLHLNDTGFRWLEVPILTKITGACENVDTLYSLDHSGVEAYLAQTGQLYLEAKIPMHKKVWTIITSSRAEKAVDNRHLNQFQLIEFEHQGNFEELLINIESIIQAMIKNVIKKATPELISLSRDIGHLKSYLKQFNRITYTDAVDILNDTPIKVNWGDDLKAEHEDFLVTKLGNIPLFITHYPKKIKFFNMRVNENNKNIVNSADLILPFSGEAAGSAEREDKYNLLIERLKESHMFKMLTQKGKTIDDFRDYLDLIKKNPILHSGCGIGFTRVSQSVLGFSDIRMGTNYPLQSNVLY